jgi:hypothetical protein
VAVCFGVGKTRLLFHQFAKKLRWQQGIHENMRASETSIQKCAASEDESCTREFAILHGWYEDCCVCVGVCAREEERKTKQQRKQKYFIFSLSLSRRIDSLCVELTSKTRRIYKYTRLLGSDPARTRESNQQSSIYFYSWK